MDKFSGDLVQNSIIAPFSPFPTQMRQPLVFVEVWLCLLNVFLASFENKVGVLITCFGRKVYTVAVNLLPSSTPVKEIGFLYRGLHLWWQ
jgi:hypothetical protein